MKTIILILSMLMAEVTVWAGSSVSALWADSLAAETSGDYAEALRVHQQIIQRESVSYVAALRAGWLFYKTEAYGMAQEWYERAVDLSPGAISALQGIMYSQVAVGDSDSAMRTAKSILRIDKNNYAVYAQMGSCYYLEESYARARASYQKLHKLFPEDLAAASGLAWAMIGEKDYEEAQPLFDYILMVSPDYSYASKGRKLCKQLTQTRDQ